MNELLNELTTSPNTVSVIQLIIASTTILLAVVCMVADVRDRISSIAETICKIMLLVSVVTAVSFGYWIRTEKHNAITQERYTIQRTDKQLTIKSESPWLKDSDFQIIGEDETNLYVKHADNDKVYTVTTKLKINDVKQ